MTLFFISSAVIAQSSLNVRVSVYVNNAPISEILSKIQKESNVFFSYNPKLIPASEKATIKVYNRSIKDILTTLFLNYNIDFQELGDNVIIYKAKGSASIYKPDLPSIVSSKKPKVVNKKTNVAPIKEKEVQGERRSVFVYNDGRNSKGIKKKKPEDDGLPHIIGLRADPDTINLDSLFAIGLDTIFDPIYAPPADTVKRKEKIKYIFEILNTCTRFPVGKIGIDFKDGLEFNQKLNQLEEYGSGIAIEQGRWRLGLGVQFAKHSDSLKTSREEDSTYIAYNITILDEKFKIYGADTIIEYVLDSAIISLTDTFNQPYNHLNTFKYFEIPLSLTYHMVHNPVISWSISTVWTNSFLIGSPVQNNSEIESAQDIFNGITKKHVMSLGATTMFLVHMDERIALKLAISYRHSFKPFEQENSYPIARRYFLGVGFGIEYLINKN